MSASARCALLLQTVAGLLTGVSLALAQEERVRLAFEHRGDGVTGFVLYAQPAKGETVRVDLGQVKETSEGMRVIPLPPLPDGSYTLFVAAYNGKGESLRALVGRISVVASRAEILTDIVPSATAPSGPSASTTPVTPRKRGIFDRIWRLLIGEDAPSP